MTTFEEKVNELGNGPKVVLYLDGADFNMHVSGSDKILLQMMYNLFVNNPGLAMLTVIALNQYEKNNKK